MLLFVNMILVALAVSVIRSPEFVAMSFEFMYIFAVVVFSQVIFILAMSQRFSGFLEVAAFTGIIGMVAPVFLTITSLLIVFSFVGTGVVWLKYPGVFKDA